MATTQHGFDPDDEPLPFAPWSPEETVVIASTPAAAAEFTRKVLVPQWTGADPDADLTPEEAIQAIRELRDAEAAILEAVSAPVTELDGLIDLLDSDGHVEPESETPRSIRARAIQAAQTVLGRPQHPATAPPAPEREAESSHAAEAQARQFSERHDMPRHKATRRSQQPVGRHGRYVRQLAQKWGVTAIEADRRIDHSKTQECEYRDA